MAPDPERQPDPDPTNGIPRWVRVSVLIVAVLVLVVVILALVLGGEHGPGRHMPGGGGLHP